MSIMIIDINIIVEKNRLYLKLLICLGVVFNNAE